jgi:hypothetical protein
MPCLKAAVVGGAFQGLLSGVAPRLRSWLVHRRGRPRSVVAGIEGRAWVSGEDSTSGLAGEAQGE